MRIKNIDHYASRKVCGNDCNTVAVDKKTVLIDLFLQFRVIVLQWICCSGFRSSQSKVHMVTQEVHQFLIAKRSSSLGNSLLQMQANLIVGNDYWWFLFGIIPYACAWVSFVLFDEDPHPVTFAVVFFGLLFFHIVALHSVVYWHREMSPFRLIGAKAKFMIEVIPVIAAAALPHLLEFDGAYYALLLCCTTYFYTFAHFMHAAYDIGGKDVFLALTMLVLVHRLNEELLVGALALILCLGLSLYRYMTYCAPELPIHPKKEMELPC
ncbi:hypothetical protein CQW23_15676 [Capsicum baccatum]|uniref:Uncharacterized protein n=1 Tax=Capsicum baccatum TaxID=33114 RepID=A0A2G2WMQ7_CAPBA|nr:hypothetical protein CQW23_15676 [Capsicum baccatum]